MLTIVIITTEGDCIMLKLFDFEFKVHQEEKLEKIQNTTANSEVKKTVIQELKGFKQKFRDRLISEAQDYIITTIVKVGFKSIPMFWEALKNAG
jgi:rRNA-processing protein FCF1